jgi:hypothetical protein
MPTSDGFVRGGPRILLRLEGLAILAAATLAYAHMGLTWWAFAALLLIPDVSMLGHLVSPAAGAASYNATHTLTTPAILAGLGALLGSHLAVSLAVIWIAHIGIDHMFGYGLKYATGFVDTHLGPRLADGSACAGRDGSRRIRNPHPNRNIAPPCCVVATHLLGPRSYEMSARLMPRHDPSHPGSPSRRPGANTRGRRQHDLSRARPERSDRRGPL